MEAKVLQLNQDKNAVICFNLVKVSEANSIDPFPALRHNREGGQKWALFRVP